MKVKMLVHSGRPGQPIKPGDIIDVDAPTGREWIKTKIAEPVDQKKDKPQPKKALP